MCFCLRNRPWAVTPGPSVEPVASPSFPPGLACCLPSSGLSPAARPTPLHTNALSSPAGRWVCRVPVGHRGRGGTERCHLAGQLTWQWAREARRPQPVPHEVQGTACSCCREAPLLLKRKKSPLLNCEPEQLVFLLWFSSLSGLGQQALLGFPWLGTCPEQE